MVNDGGCLQPKFEEPSKFSKSFKFHSNVSKNGGGSSAGGSFRDSIDNGLVRQEISYKKAVGEKETAKCGDEHLPEHSKPKEQDDEVVELLVRGISGNRFCRDLDLDEVGAIVLVMEHYEFAENETVIQEGQAGRYFFVVGSGNLEVSVAGEVINTIEPGTAFGGMALCYGCNRTATVTARGGAAGIWGADGDVFRRVLKEHTQRHLEANQRFLDQMCCFDGMSQKDKARVSELDLLTESFEAGTRVITQGEMPKAVYFVKDGTLEFISGGEWSCKGLIGGGTREGTLKKGDCFGWRAVLYNKSHSFSVIAETHCDVVCISVSQLEEVLGPDFATKLERNFVLSVFAKMPVLSLLSRARLERLAQEMELKSYEPDETFPKDSRLVVVADGEAKCGSRSLRRGAWCEDDDIRNLMQDEESGSPRTQKQHCRVRPEALVPGPRGCRLATLSHGALRRAVLDSDSASLNEEGAALIFLRKVLLVRKVAVFRELSDEQVTAIVEALESRRFSSGSIVFQAGDASDAFHAVASGELEELKDDKEVSLLTSSDCFGARSLLFSETRSTTLRVRSASAELWTLARSKFCEIISEPMRQSLALSMQLSSSEVSLKLLKHVRLVGAGSFGSVRMVEHKRTGMRYALKRVKKAKSSKNDTDKVKQECALLRQVVHPFILRLVGTFESAKSIYILTELISGGQMYEQVLQGLGVLQRKAAQFYAASIVLILEALHEKNIVYRDLKPENVMLDMQGYCKLVDFGLAKQLSTPSPRTYTLVGTLYYMAPEVIRGQGYGVECDVWSLGILLYELVCGKVPFGSGTSKDQTILEDIIEGELEFPSKYNDSAGKRLIKGLLEKDSDKRLGVCGTGGWNDVKINKWFKTSSGSQDIFSQIQGRDLEAPVKPNAEKYSDEKELGDTVTLSDSEELGQDDDADTGKTIMAAFTAFDLNGDGKIDRWELGQVLSKVDPKVFTDEVCDRLMAAADEDGDGSIMYNEFVQWLFADGDSALIDVRKFAKLDVHR